MHETRTGEGFLGCSYHVRQGWLSLASQVDMGDVITAYYYDQGLADFFFIFFIFHLGQ